MGSPPQLSGQGQATADDLPHYLARPRVDALHAAVAPQARDLVLVHVAGAAEQLEAAAYDLALPPAGPQLRRRGFLVAEFPGQVRLDGPVAVGPGHGNRR